MFSGAVTQWVPTQGSPYAGLLDPQTDALNFTEEEIDAWGSRNRALTHPPTHPGGAEPTLTDSKETPDTLDGGVDM